MGRACRGIRRAPPRLHGPMGGRLARGSGWVHEAVAGRPVGRSSLTERRPASAVRRALRRHRSRVGALPRGHFHCGVSPSGGPAGRSDDMYSGLTSMPSAVCLVSSAAGSLPPSSLVARFVQRAGRLHRLRAGRKGRMRRRNPGRGAPAAVRCSHLACHICRLSRLRWTPSTPSCPLPRPWPPRRLIVAASSSRRRRRPSAATTRTVTAASRPTRHTREATRSSRTRGATPPSRTSPCRRWSKRWPSTAPRPAASTRRSRPRASVAARPAQKTSRTSAPLLTRRARECRSRAVGTGHAHADGLRTVRA